MERPILTPHLTSHNIGEAQTLFVSETFNTLLHGPLLCDLLPLLDGMYSIEEIQATLGNSYPTSAVTKEIRLLSAKGYIVSGDYAMESSRAAFWSSLGASPRYAEQRLAKVEVVVNGMDQSMDLCLESMGLAVGSSNPDLTIYISEDFLDVRFDDVNRDHIKRGKAWLLVKPNGVQPLFGPVFYANGSGPCWECLSSRLRNHQEVHTFLRNFAGEAAALKPKAMYPRIRESIYGLIAAEVAKWFVFGEIAPLDKHAISQNLATLECTKHQVRKRPQCPTCGDRRFFNSARAPVPIRLQASPKNQWHSGGERSVAPEVTLAKYRHLVSPISGVVTWLSSTTDELDSWLHVHWAGSNLGMRSRNLSLLRRSLRSKSAGKGASQQQSEVSAMCEAIERYSGTFQGDEIRSKKRYTEFASASEVIHPNAIQLFSDDQLDNAESINAKGHPYNVVPRRFDEEALIDWSPVWSLASSCHRYLPTSMLYNSSPEQRSADDLIADSNGCAAGNTLEEAILQGFCELVERDAFAIWWYNQLRVPEVDLASFEDPYLASAKNYYAQYKREVWLLDVTSDLGIPTFVSVSRKLNADTEDIIYGAGAHFSPRIAALRAICELNQCLTWLPRPGVSDGSPMIDDPLALWWWKSVRIDECIWLQPQADVPLREASSFPLIESSDTMQDVQYCVTLMQSLDLDFLVLDQTRPDIGMPVVRVLVPGLRHFWARFAPGRLYEVPVQLGRQKTLRKESELNPMPVIA